MFGKWNEGAWRYGADFGMLPAEKRTETKDLSTHPGLWLVMDAQFMVGKGRTQIMLERGTLPQLHIHVAVEKSYRVASIQFRAIEGRIGIGEQRRKIVAVAWIDGAVDAQADGYPLPRISNSAAIDFSSRSATVVAAADCPSVPRTSVNSSPPTRAMNAPSAAASSRRDMAQSSSSPNA